MDLLLERLKSSSPGPVSDRCCSVTHQLQGVYDPELVGVIYGIDVEGNEAPATVYQRLRDVGNKHYADNGVIPPLNFTQALLAGMFSAPWTTDAYMEFVLDVFE